MSRLQHAPFAALMVVSVHCAQKQTDAPTTSATTSTASATTTSATTSPSLTATTNAPSSPSATRPFYALASAEHAKADIDSILKTIDALPETTNHPGKRPWSRGDVLDRLDAMAALDKQGVVAMGTYAHDRAKEPIENSDPRSAYGGGPGPDLGAFNDLAMMMLENAVHVRATKAGDDGAAITALYRDIATTPLPIFSNSGGAEDGRAQRDALVALLSRYAPSAFGATAKERAAIPYKDNRR